MTTMKNMAAGTEYRRCKLADECQDGITLRFGDIWRHRARKPNSNALKWISHRRLAFIKLLIVNVCRCRGRLENRYRPFLIAHRSGQKILEILPAPSI